MGVDEGWPLDASVDNLGTSPGKLLRVNSLLLQEGVQRIVQVYESKPSMHSSVFLWWKLLELRKGQKGPCMLAVLRNKVFCAF